jgi:hypothetical protein
VGVEKASWCCCGLGCRQLIQLHATLSNCWSLLLGLGRVAAALTLVFAVAGGKRRLWSGASGLVGGAGVT